MNLSKVKLLFYVIKVIVYRLLQMLQFHKKIKSIKQNMLQKCYKKCYKKSKLDSTVTISSLFFGKISIIDFFK
jgi:hypothetical protein